MDANLNPHRKNEIRWSVSDSILMLYLISIYDASIELSRLRFERCGHRLTKRIKIIVLNFMICTALNTLEAKAQQTDDNVRDCIKKEVLVSAAKLADDHSWILADVTNKLPFAIAGVRYSARVRSVGRTIPWVDKESFENIPGGIEPGETRHLSLYAGTPDETFGVLFAEVSVLDIVDVALRPLIGDTRYYGWAEGRVDFKCVSDDSSPSHASTETAESPSLATAIDKQVADDQVAIDAALAAATASGMKTPTESQTAKSGTNDQPTGP